MSVIITAVHPRIRGERTNRSAPARINRGSSPHTRGTLTGPRPEPPLPRFIPAYAGNACAGHQSVRDLTVHPRIRGERIVSAKDEMMTIGSSPHTRGTLSTRSARQRHRRFIPAYAGNAFQSVQRSSQAAVHPRIRGERVFTPAIQCAATGSSPHTRGTLCRWWPGAGAGRFIPAYAGNARASQFGRRPSAVHPRIRGERNRKKVHILRISGSSPHTRGTLLVPPHPCQRLSVHPRIRGERNWMSAFRAPQLGSSPHTRGTHFQ